VYLGSNPTHLYDEDDISVRVGLHQKNIVLTPLLIMPKLKWMIENSLRRVILEQKLHETDESNKDVRRNFQND
jgi:hypothetical protein